MQVLITGGSGCVGRAVVRQFLKNGWKVTVLVHPNDAHLFPFSPEEKIKIVAKILNNVSVVDIPEECIVVHLAANVHTVPKTEKEIQDFFYVNRDGTIKLAQCAKKRNIKGFVFVSTNGVYGDKLHEEICSEETLPTPNSPYTQSKYEAEQQLLQIFSESFPLIIFRPSVMFGPGDRGNFLKLFKMTKRGFVPMIQGGQSLKNILYVNDLASVIKFAASNLEKFNARIYNVAYSKPYTFYELISAVSKVTKKNVLSVSVPKFLLLPPAILCEGISYFFKKELPLSIRKLNILGKNSVMQTDKLMMVLNNQLKLHSFEEGLKDYIQSGFSPWGTLCK
ncbi:MAG: NAD(P)-dependent oxidoreductase [Planctomycetaceae bacterium]|jgi:nucleoside-diphosphate-sugar epimerase|nr:NAD(P)-dependent oxidoreductase [Planctomycetaceae bacterium]